jgi:hypothetical protein
MKKVLLVALSLLMVAPAIQAKDKEDEVKIVLIKEENSDSYYYEGIVPVEGVSKEEMFKRAKVWVLSNFKTGDVNSRIDETNLTIFNSPTILVRPAKAHNDDYVNFKLNLFFKDGKYKFRFDNLIIKTNNDPYASPTPYKEGKIFKGMWGNYNQNLIASINISLFGLAVDLEKTIKGTKTSSDNW